MLLFTIVKDISGVKDMMWKDLLAFYGGFRLLDDLTNGKGGGNNGGCCGCLVLIAVFFLFYILFC